MTPEHLARLDDRLRAEQRRLQAELDGLGPHAAPVEPSVRDDTAPEREARELAVRRDRTKQRLGEVEDALGRLQDGSIDRCVTCGDTVDEEVLLQDPTAVPRCGLHASAGNRTD